jgi:hypothetical protein
MAITLRSVKGSELTHAELDTNFTDLRDGVALQVPKTQGATGIKVDSLGTPTYGWHDLLAKVDVEPGVNAPSWAVYRGSIKQYQFTEAVDYGYLSWHIPHDYVIGTDIFVHCHWSQILTTVTGGSVTFGYELTYAKGHDQAAFPATKTVTVLQNASTTQYQHMIAEGAASVSGGSATQLDTDLLEPDGVILGRVYVDSNDITVSGGGVPEPFIHFVDMHYQTTNVGTKQRQPDFWT